MNDDKLIRLTNLAGQLYSEFLDDETICGLASLFKKNNIGSKTGGHIRKILYQKYGKKNVDKISSKRTSINSHKKRSKESYRHTDEWNKNISDGNKTYWDKDDGTRKELSRKLMAKYCVSKSQTEEVKKRRVKSRSWYKHSKETIQKIRKSNSGRKLTEAHKAKLRKTRIRKGVPHSEKTKRKLSLITLQQWKSGIHKPKFKSKGQIEMIEILQNLGYSVKDEHIVNGRPFDAFVKDENLLIEFNGTFWHRDPRVEKYKNDPMSESIWMRDKEKIDNAKKLGYDVRVVWQKDWESCPDKVEFIKQIL